MFSNFILQRLTDDPHSDASSLGFPKGIPDIVKDDTDEEIAVKIDAANQDAAIKISAAHIAVLKTELIDPKYTGKTTEEIVAMMNESPEIVTTKNVPKPYELSDIYAVFTVNEQLALIADFIFPTFETIIETKDVLRIKSFLNILFITKKLSASSYAAATTVLDATMPQSITTHGIPRYTTLAQGVPYCPNQVTSEIISEVIAY